MILLSLLLMYELEVIKRMSMIQRENAGMRLNLDYVYNDDDEISAESDRPRPRQCIDPSMLLFPFPRKSSDAKQWKKNARRPQFYTT